MNANSFLTRHKDETFVICNLEFHPYAIVRRICTICMDFASSCFRTGLTSPVYLKYSLLWETVDKKEKHIYFRLALIDFHQDCRLVRNIKDK